MQPRYALTVRRGRWSIWVHGPHVPKGSRHVHISQKKLGGKYSWNVDGSRHDKREFPTHEKGLKTAKRIAAEYLGIPASHLSLMTMVSPAERLLIDIDASTAYPAHAPIVFVPDPSNGPLWTVVLQGRAGRIHVVIMEEA